MTSRGVRWRSSAQDWVLGLGYKRRSFGNPSVTNLRPSFLQCCRLEVTESSQTQPETIQNFEISLNGFVGLGYSVVGLRACSVGKSPLEPSLQEGVFLQN